MPYNTSFPPGRQAWIATGVGVPVKEKGEQVKAFIVLKEDELPKTMVGKILRLQLIEEENEKTAEKAKQR